MENFAYPVTGTPCEMVVGQQYHCFASRLVEHFRLDSEFDRLGVESYADYTLNDAPGRPRGLISIISRKPLERPAFVESVLRIFAVRASAEIDRARASDASEDAIYVHDWYTGAIVDVNPRACDLSGFSHEELLRSTLRDISAYVPPYTNEEAMRWIEQAKRDGVARFEWQRRNKDGSLHWDEVVLRSARIAGRPRVLAFTREVTERKLRERELRPSEDRLGRIIEFNPATEACFGHRRVDVSGRRLADLLVPGRLREAFVRDFESYLQSGTAPFLGRRIETCALRADGTIFIGYLRDISEIKAAGPRRVRPEAQLRQAQRMEAIGQLTGGIAHDFNNPLTSIMGYVTLASERQERHGDGRLEGYLAQARRSCDRARDLIQQMLMFSRGQRDEVRPVDVADATCAGCRAAASGAGTSSSA